MTQLSNEKSFHYGGVLSRRRLVSSALVLSALSGTLMLSGGKASAQQATPPFGPSVSGQNKNIFYFTPWGSQLDGDDTFGTLHVPNTSLPTVINYNIYDINIQKDTPQDFDVYLYTTAPQYITGRTLKSFRFTGEFDTDEYNVLGFTPNTSYISGACPSVPMPGDPSSIINCNFAAGLTVTNGAFANPIKLGTIFGVTVSPGPAPDDGMSDVKLTLNQILYNTPPTSPSQVASVAGQFQDVELQVPAPLPILGIGVAFGSIRKARKFSSKLNAFKMG